MSRKKAIGIDLGTSKCCVGVVRDGKLEILENERGNKTTPSYVAFTDTERLVGEDAKDQATLNPANTVFGIKRIIGRESMDGLLREAVDKMPYTIMNKNEEENCIHVSYKETEELLLPQQITAMLLGKMKDLAEHHLESRVEAAVISVPASFSNAQRQATKDAAAIAGLKVLALINEPTAAAIAYQANRRITDDETIAVVDFGAGNFDIAIVTVRRGRVFARAVSGSTAIGGNEIDEVLMQYVCSKFKEKHGQQLPESPAMTERLRSCCEKLKRKLTLLNKVQETLDCFGDDNVLPVIINRKDFDGMMPVVVQSSLKNCLHRTMQASGISPKDLSRVVLVGGSSRIPLFQTWLEEIFGPNSLDKSVNPDEAVAFGATLYAAMLCGNNELDEFAVKDCVPNDYCISSNGDSTTQTVFEQHSSKTLPQRRVFSFNGHSPFNKQTRTHTFELYEELTGQLNPHRLIGTLCLEDEFSQAVSLITNVTLEVDRCGIFNAVVQLDPNHIFPEVVKNYAGKLSTDKLKHAVEREQQFRRDDQDERERVKAMSSLEALSFRLQSTMGDSKAKELFPELVNEISDKVKANIQWLDATNTVAKTECVKRENTLEKLNNNLKLQLQEHEKKELERVTVVDELNEYLMKLDAFSSGPDLSEEREQAAEIKRQVGETRHWLQSTETPSKHECLEKGRLLEKLHNILQNKLEERRKETERITAVDNLRAYCNHLEEILTSDPNGEEHRDLTVQVRNQVRDHLLWLNEASYTSAAECEAKKISLNESHAKMKETVLRRRADKEAEKRATAVRRLRAYCNMLSSSVVTCNKYKDFDPGLVEHLENEVRETLGWLRDETVTKETCDDRLSALENLEETLKNLLEIHKQNEANRITAQRKFQTYVVEVKASFPVLMNACKNDDKLVCDIAESMTAISLWLKNDTSFSNTDYEVKLEALGHLIKRLKNRMEYENLNALNHASNCQLDSFKRNKAYDLRVHSNANASPGAGKEGHNGTGPVSRQVGGKDSGKDREAVADANDETRSTRQRSAGTKVKQDEEDEAKNYKRGWLAKKFYGNNR